MATAKEKLVGKVMDMTETQCKKVMPQMSGMMKSGNMMNPSMMGAGSSKKAPNMSKKRR